MVSIKEILKSKEFKKKSPKKVNLLVQEVLRESKPVSDKEPSQTQKADKKDAA